VNKRFAFSRLFMTQFQIGGSVVPKSNNNDQTELRSGSSLADELNAIALHCAKRQIVSHLSDDEILGYDESGVPTR